MLYTNDSIKSVVVYHVYQSDCQMDELMSVCGYDRTKAIQTTHSYNYNCYTYILGHEQMLILTLEQFLIFNFKCPNV